MATAAIGDPAAHRSLEVLRTLFGERLGTSIGVRFWDGTSLMPASNEPTFVLALNAPHALRAAFAPPIDLSPGRAYVEGTIDIEGDAEAAVDALAAATAGLSKIGLARLGARLLRLPRPPKAHDDGHTATLRGRKHSRARDAAAVGFHYDQPVAFYRAILDPALVYSCAYWDDGVETLADAQAAKIDHVLRKVRLRSGQRLLDIGCGWGSLAIRAAQRFGARVVGITLSRRQAEEARRRVEALGLEDRVDIQLRDYRELGGEKFDAVVSIGMVEHVGRERLPTYFRAAWNALRDGGFFLNHGIAALGARGWRSSGFIARYVFPDGDLVPLAEMTRRAEETGFEVRDVEDLREHYARTLRAWVANFERHREEAIAATDERTYRIWRLYMAGSAQGFHRARMACYQSLLAKPRSDGSVPIPLTRRDLYGTASAPA